MLSGCCRTCSSDRIIACIRLQLVNHVRVQLLHFSKRFLTSTCTGLHVKRHTERELRKSGRVLLLGKTPHRRHHFELGVHLRVSNTRLSQRCRYLIQGTVSHRPSPFNSSANAFEETSSLSAGSLPPPVASNATMASVTFTTANK